MSAIEAFLKARDFLLAHSRDYATAYRDFAWPQLTEFNWALDYFDRMAVGNEKPALWIVKESGQECKVSFAQMSARSNQVANWLGSLGVERGDRILMVLGNEVPLWETMLAAIKLGAVLIPATALLTAEDLRDRMGRGDVKHVVIGAAHTDQFADLAGNYTRVCVGSEITGWKNFADSIDACADYTPDGVTRATDPLLLYFTSGTTTKPKLVLHTHQSYPVGHLSTSVTPRRTRR